MAIFTFKTTLKCADELCRHERMFDMREKVKGIKVGDVIKYEPWYAGRPVRGHDILDKRFEVIYVDGEDPRIMRGFDIFQLAEIEPDFN